MIYNFKKFNEKLRIDDLDSPTISQLKTNLLFRLKELRISILSNIVIDEEANDIEYKNFEEIEDVVILRELSKEFTKELIDELEIKSFLNEINGILLEKKRNTKKLIREAFDRCYEKINKKFK